MTNDYKTNLKNQLKEEYQESYHKLLKQVQDLLREMKNILEKRSNKASNRLETEHAEQDNTLVTKLQQAIKQTTRDDLKVAQLSRQRKKLIEHTWYKTLSHHTITDGIKQASYMDEKLFTRYENKIYQNVNDYKQKLTEWKQLTDTATNNHRIKTLAHEIYHQHTTGKSAYPSFDYILV